MVAGAVMPSVMKNPTQLFIGNEEETTNHATELLQSHFCKNNKDWLLKQVPGSNPYCFCIDCKQIKRNQHPFVVWIQPESEYKLQDITVIFEKTKFALDENQQFFFVLSSIEKLTKATANKLLKILEEPPAGYNFLLLTKNENLVLPTIKSRCLITHLSPGAEAELEHPLLKYFLDENKLNDPIGFEKELKIEHISDMQAIELIDQLITYFKKKIINFCKSNKKIEIEELQKTVLYLQNKLKYPPQSGSAKIFLKNIFLGFRENE